MGSKNLEKSVELNNSNNRIIGMSGGSVALLNGQMSQSVSARNKNTRLTQMAMQSVEVGPQWNVDMAINRCRLEHDCKKGCNEVVALWIKLMNS